MIKYYMHQLKDLRKIRFVSMSELAELSGVGTDTLYRLQRGEEVTPTTLKRVAKALNVSVGRDEKGIYFYEEESTSKARNSLINEIAEIAENVPESSLKQVRDLLQTLRENVRVDSHHD